jgi:3-oxoadipate enol-lactonase
MGRYLNHRISRPGQDIALLLVHPLGGSLAFWDECVALWKTYSCLAVDLRSTGASPAAEGSLDLDTHVKDLKDLLDHLATKRVVAVGCALGSLVAASFAARHPDRVDAIVMANPEIRLNEAARHSLRQRAALIRMSGMADLLPETADRIFAGLPRDERYNCYSRSFAEMDPEAHARSILGLVDADITAQIAAIGCPTLLVPAEHDIFTAPENLAELFGDAETVTLKTASHFGPYQAPDKFAVLVDDFIARRLRL